MISRPLVVSRIGDPPTRQVGIAIEDRPQARSPSTRTVTRVAGKQNLHRADIWVK
ncbi:MAG: hypothetical protein LUG96_08570 [Tannerellaceae bacterium]|nr:hypothetical protein [Tannerellaceae bacterium]MCD7915288.1 hypothetical protein [Tannerellaceae bacterium]